MVGAGRGRGRGRGIPIAYPDGMNCKPAPDPTILTHWVPPKVPSFVPSAADHELLRLRKKLLRAPADFRIVEEPPDQPYARYSDRYVIEEVEPFHKVCTVPEIAHPMASHAVCALANAVETAHHDGGCAL